MSRVALLAYLLISFFLGFLAPHFVAYAAAHHDPRTVRILVVDRKFSGSI